MLRFSPLLVAALSLATAWQLWSWYRLDRANPNVLVAWIAAFVALAVSSTLTFLLFFMTANHHLYGLIRGFRFIFSIIALTLLYWGAIRFVARGAFWRHLLPVTYLFAATLVTIYFVGVAGITPAFTAVAAFVFLLPMQLFLGMLFLFIHGILLGEHVGRVRGPLWLAIGFLVLAIETVALPFVIDLPGLPWWYVVRAAGVALMLVGFRRLHREADGFLRNQLHPKRRYLSSRPDRV